MERCPIKIENTKKFTVAHRVCTARVHSGWDSTFSFVWWHFSSLCICTHIGVSLFGSEMACLWGCEDKLTELDVYNTGLSLWWEQDFGWSGRKKCCETTNTHQTTWDSNVASAHIWYICGPDLGRREMKNANLFIKMVSLNNKIHKSKWNAQIFQ